MSVGQARLAGLWLAVALGASAALAGRVAAASAAPLPGPVALASLREALREEVLGDAVLEPAWAPGLVVFVLLQPQGLASRGGRDTIDLELVRRQPGAAAYYLWRAMGRATEHGLSFWRALLVVPGEASEQGGPAPAAPGPALRVQAGQVQALWEASGPGQGPDSAPPELGPFDPSTALNHVRVWVDGQPWQPDPAMWARAADLLASDGDRWLGRYRAMGSLGAMPDVSPLERAQRLYQAALELYPAHPAARTQLSAVEEKLQAVSLFARAERLIEEHERPLREADRRHDDLAATRHSFYLWRAVDLLEQALELDRSLMGGAAALERIRRLLGDRPKPAYETAAQLEAELRVAYVQQAVELDYDQARRSGEAARGTRVHLRGQVLRRIEGTRAMPAAVVVALVEGGEPKGAGTPPQQEARARPIVYVQLPGPLPGVPEGSLVEVWGELVGNYRYRDPSGRPTLVVRVAAAYVEPAGGGASGAAGGR